MIQFFRRFLLFILFLPLLASAQQEDIEIKVYGFQEGITHRNVFKIQQDPWGFIWIATINGLNKFDGHEFIHYNSHDTENFIPFDFISDMQIAPDSLIWLVSQNAITVLNPQNNDINTVKIDSNSIIHNQSFQLSSFSFNNDNQFKGIANLNETGQSFLVQNLDDGSLMEVFECKGNLMIFNIMQP